MTDVGGLVEDVRSGDERSLARAISILEDRQPGHRDLSAAIRREPGDAHVVGVTGSPGVGKSTLVDAMVSLYRERGQTVGVVAVDPASPVTGGALLGDRVRMRAAANREGVFVRSMSARGITGGLAAAALDAVAALSAAGKDVVIVETVGVGQAEVDLAGAADTVVLVTQPGSGDDVQALKAGLLETGDLFVVNKADRPGVERTVRALREMVQRAGGHGSFHAPTEALQAEWTPPVVETVATEATGVAELLEAVAEHRSFLADAGLDVRADRRRVAEAIRTHLRSELADAVEREIDDAGGMDGLVDAVLAGETDPLAVAEGLAADDPGRSIVDRDP